MTLAMTLESAPKEDRSETIACICTSVRPDARADEAKLAENKHARAIADKARKEIIEE